MAMLFVFMAGVSLHRNRSSDGPSDASPVTLYFLIGVAYAAFCLGPEVFFRDRSLGRGPWLLLMDVPGFSSIRTPSRFYLVTSLCFAIVASFGAARVIEWAGRKRAVAAILAYILLFSVVVVESWSAPMHTRTIRDLKDAPGFYKWIAQQPDNGAVLEIPPFHGRPGYSEGRYRMYYSNIHKRMTVDSESSFLPPVIDYIVSENFNSDRTVAYMKKLNAAGLRYIVYHMWAQQPEQITKTRETMARIGAKLEKIYGDDELYVLPPKPPFIPFNRENVQVSVSLPSRIAIGGEGRVTISLTPKLYATVFERAVRTLSLELVFKNNNGRGSRQVLMARFAPPLMTPDDPERAEVRYIAPQVAGDYTVFARLMDEDGKVWAEASSAVKVDAKPVMLPAYPWSGLNRADRQPRPGITPK